MFPEIDSEFAAYNHHIIQLILQFYTLYSYIFIQYERKTSRKNELTTYVYKIYWIPNKNKIFFIIKNKNIIL